MQLRRVGLVLLVVSVVVVSGGGVAGAMQPVRDWTGPYVGAFAGYGWGDGRATAPYDSNTGWFYNFTGSPYSVRTGGAFAGVLGGHNWQSGNVVYGLEGEIGYLGLSGSALDPNSAIADTETRLRTDLFGALNARLGWAVGSALVYAKGGVAFLKARASTIDPCMNAPGCGTTTLSMHGRDTLVGWSVGAGAEWMLAPSWSARVDYAYFDFGSVRTEGVPGGPVLPFEFYRQTIDVTAHTVRLGLSYRFGAPASVGARLR